MGSLLVEALISKFFKSGELSMNVGSSAGSQAPLLSQLLREFTANIHISGSAWIARLNCTRAPQATGPLY